MSSLKPEHIDAFVGSMLAPRFDNPAPTPDFHRTLWDLCLSDKKYVAIAAPRGHAKSTSVTLSYLLTVLLFREKQFAVIVSDTEGQAVQFLGDIKLELEENTDLRQRFMIKGLEKDSQTDLICSTTDGHQFRIIAKGSEQKVRGLKWRSKRPDLIVCDDLENDEIVMNKERREKFRNWFYKALMPCMSDTGQIRVVGTILHLDSLLERLLNDDTWDTHRFAAHNDDFSWILWPEKFSKERLLGIRRGYAKQGMPEGYSQEYLNYPIDEESAYFRNEDFIFYDKDDLKHLHLNYYAAVDFAITSKSRSDFTVIAVAGLDSDNNMYVVDCRRGRWDSKEIIDEIFSVQQRYTPDVFTMEAGMIEKSLGPFLKEEMFRRGLFLNLNTMTPVVDKEQRARSIQARMRAGGVKFDKDASWYPDLQQEMVRFPRDVHDDQVDALAWIGLTLDKMAPGLTNREYEDDVWEEEYGDYSDFTGINSVTGY